MKDKPSVIKAGNNVVAIGLKCQHCNLIRPFERQKCTCQESKNPTKTEHNPR